MAMWNRRSTFQNDMWGTALLHDVAHPWRPCGLLHLRNLSTVSRLAVMTLDQTRRKHTKRETDA